jgi:glyoxylase-like metal-dependent hydrolase (beta-lactamase superfamily II)
MNLHAINTGYFKLDGGAVFGIVPKSIWNKTNPADENNLCSWALRCLLIEEGDKLILIDTGIGDKQHEKFFRRLCVHENAPIEKLLQQRGFTSLDVTDVFLSHLHFDHCGGSIRYNEVTEIAEPTFLNANYWVNETHWKWAVNPNLKERESFLQENILPIQESGQLKFLSTGHDLLPSINVRHTYGHTECMMLPFIQFKGKTVVFVADLIASAGHIALPYIMSYDIRPLTTLSEKEHFLNEAADKEYILFFEHDYKNECCTVQHTEKGVRIKDTFTLNEFFSNDYGMVQSEPIQKNRS